jgi:hypothetical protein
VETLWLPKLICDDGMESGLLERGRYVDEIEALSDATLTLRALTAFIMLVLIKPWLLYCIGGWDIGKRVSVDRRYDGPTGAERFEAGNGNTRSVPLMGAGREVDIPLRETLLDSGLMVGRIGKVLEWNGS